ncbi:zinc ribbon-containing protein [Marinobacter sp. JSM 1782161]|uniref:zinc ribbon-containing protein n=1 Tax=Marinobacter sp. JSM 1782161 TaxID=2685906 RepID=UPI0014020E77|nr:zinc ribbon-containing protein [Marinobacter sp. JSM 1782161]
MSEKQTPEFTGQALKVYNRMLERVVAQLNQVERKSWDALRESVDEAVEFENELEEMTREEVDLLAAYVKRDVGHLMHFVEETGEGVGEWLRLDLALIERQLLDLLFSVADRTRLDTLELDHKLHHDPGQYIAGEIATAGVLRCVACGHMVCLVETSHIQPCDACNSHYFERVTARWPHEPEVSGEAAGPE